MNDPSREVVYLVKQWVDYAEEDLRTANHTLTMSRDCPYRIVCFHKPTACREIHQSPAGLQIDPVPPSTRHRGAGETDSIGRGGPLLWCRTGAPNGLRNSGSLPWGLGGTIARGCRARRQGGGEGEIGCATPSPGGSTRVIQAVPIEGTTGPVQPSARSALLR